MQKILFLCFTLFMLAGLPVMAESVVVGVLALDSLSTANPPKSITVRLIQPLILDDLSLDEGTEIRGNVIDVVSPKRLKRNAKFTFVPLTYINKSGVECRFEDNVTAIYSKPLDKRGIVKKGVVGVGNFFYKGLNMGVAAVEGAVKNEDGNRFESSIHSAYEASPVSYVEKGHDIVIRPQDIFYLKFKN